MPGLQPHTEKLHIKEHAPWSLEIHKDSGLHWYWATVRIQSSLKPPFFLTTASLTSPLPWPCEYSHYPSPCTTACLAPQFPGITQLLQSLSALNPLYLLLPAFHTCYHYYTLASKFQFLAIIWIVGFSSSIEGKLTFLKGIFPQPSPHQSIASVLWC